MSEELHPAAEQSQNPKTPCRVDHGQPNEIISDDIDSAHCLYCSEFVNTDGIFCEKCEMRLHYQCVMLTDEDRVQFETLNDSFYCLSCSCERQCSDSVNSSILSLDLRNPLETDPISGFENTHTDSGQPCLKKQD